MAFRAGDTVFIVESNHFIREAEVRSCSGGMYLVKFKDKGGGIKLKEHSKDLKKRGFKYVGEVTIYSHLQACGIINDHDETCPCYAKINKMHPTVNKRRDKEV